MRLDRKINLALTVERDQDTVYVHSTPLREEVFDTFFMTLSRTWAAMTAEGGEWMLRMGPRNAARVLKKIATEAKEWDGAAGVQTGFLAEIRRTSNVIFPSEEGWQSMLLQEAVDRKFLTVSDAREVENALTFFTLGCATESPKKADSMMSTVFGLFGAQLTSLDSTAFQASLPTSTPAESTGETGKASSIPV